MSIKLTKVQKEIITILQEECAEVIQAQSKVIRFGLEENQHQLEKEIGDVVCMIELAVQYGLADAERIVQAVEEKREKLKIYSKIPIKNR